MDQRISAVSESLPPSPREEFRSCQSLHVASDAHAAVDAAIALAKFILASDPYGFFVYKYPERKNRPHEKPPRERISVDTSVVASDSESVSDSSESSVDLGFQWTTIRDYSLNQLLMQIREYIGTWQLGANTKFVLVTQAADATKMFGQRYFVNAIFSKPIPSCPNPLATAHVNFTVHVSHVLPRFYPVMVTYQFEGYRSIYFTMGEKALQSKTFQRYYIDSMLHVKLTFYAEVFTCRHGKAESDFELGLVADGDDEDDADDDQPLDASSIYSMRDSLILQDMEGGEAPMDLML